MQVAVIGLGKLGSPMAACFAARGHRVIGVDVNQRYVQLINEGQPPVFEPGLEEMLAQTDGRLTATTDIAHAVSHSDISYLIVPTPSEPNGAFSMKYVLTAADAIGQALRDKNGHHIVVLTSTVMPGATGGLLLPTLEKASGKRCPKDFGLCYSPEFISLGSVVRDMLHPDFILIGESDAQSGETVAAAYRSVVLNNPQVARMSFANAELTKLALNTFVTTKISYANMLAEICENLEGGDVDAVTSALGLDTRVGPKYLKGSLGYGGPCFPRDNVALTTLSRQLGVTAPLPEVTDRINHGQAPRLVRLVQALLPAGGVAGVLGLAYKPQTNVVEKSQGLQIAQTLAGEGDSVIVHDPWAMEAARAALGPSVSYAASPAECARQADVLVVALPCKEFHALTPADVRGRTVIDCWRLLDRTAFAGVCNYVALGTADVQRALVAVRSATGRTQPKAA